MCQVRTWPLQTRPARTKASAIMPPWVNSRIFCFGCRSAIEPPQVEKSSIGAEATAAAIPSSSFDWVS